MRKFLKNQKGLTLVELLAVIVILGVIAAIAVPSIGNIIQKSREDGLKADAIMYLNAAKLYSLENGGNVQTIDDDSASGATHTLSDLQDYIEDAGGSIAAHFDDITFNSDGVPELTTTAITVGNATITFNSATIADINEHNSGSGGTIGQ
ncbi:MAG: prepilin-type N-terminal cleavage/methylation domain-containing protein [Bacillaceae bacterium]|nr:prepilin-type N-terminal cleavage/methylation domain-containing protein [Bacillaceae bacterium]